MLELHQVSVRRGDRFVLTNVSLTLGRGEILGLVFQQDAGKTELLRVAAGLVIPSDGFVRYCGAPIDERRSGAPTMGMVFADGGLLETSTIFDNVALPLRYHTTRSEEEIADRVHEALSWVGLGDAAERFPWQVGRERARLAALARALSYDPDLVLIDDFFLGTDASSFSRMRKAVRAGREARGIAFLLIMEARPEDFGIADRLCLVDHGAVVEVDRPSLLL